MSSVKTFSYFFKEFSLLKFSYFFKIWNKFILNKFTSFCPSFVISSYFSFQLLNFCGSLLALVMGAALPQQCQGMTTGREKLSHRSWKLVGSLFFIIIATTTPPQMNQQQFLLCMQSSEVILQLASRGVESYTNDMISNFSNKIIGFVPLVPVVSKAIDLKI